MRILRKLFARFAERQSRARMAPKSPATGAAQAAGRAAVSTRIREVLRTAAPDRTSAMFCFCFT